jgi:RecB family exonuclease
MVAWWASAFAVAALFLACSKRQALRALDLAPFRPVTAHQRIVEADARQPRLADQAWLRPEPLARMQSMLAEAAASRSGPSDAVGLRVHSRDGPCQDCPRSGLAPAGDDEPPAGHTTRYSAEVRSFATYRDLYQPD